MSGTGLQLALVVLLVMVNALFAGTEMALVTLRDAQVRRLEERAAGGRALAQLARDPNRYLATIQIGITLAGFLASAAAAVSLAEPLEEPLGFLGRAAGPVSVVAVTIVLSYVTLVLGELAPKRVAMQRAEGWSLLAARPLSVLSTLARPAVWLLSRSTDVVVRLAGGDPALGRGEATEEELRDMVATSVRFTPHQRRIIDGAFEIAERTLAQVLRPRPDVVVLASESSVGEALRQLADSGYSRAPVAPAGNLDDVTGFVHLRDLLGDPSGAVAPLVQELPVLPETAEVLAALHELQDRHAQLAVVVDEHGGSVGIVTVEDLIEEIVGEIYDEADPDLAAVIHDDDGSLLVSGRFPVHDLTDLGLEDVPDGPFTTVAGLVLDQLGRLPDRPGDAVEVGDWRFEVTRIRRRAIAEVRLRRRRGERHDE
ncbi:hemolysin family protein [Actinomarinicola tropica]|uniref:DUF21 domain-containing protein n=1 Tax=Actinomarinicola tropica TaxID=2789776 RepID=A0A5Q2RE26_9ACTN|nr:hemolysin family protein [Actinomarinicola tropica]QGG95158.1 DUF21 domain-containing protein [Actinomarinicola tropica]